MVPRILVVDDEELFRGALRERLTAEGYEAVGAADGAAAAQLLEGGGLDLAIIDLRLPDMDGMELLKTALALDPGFPVIIVTAYSSVGGAVEAMKRGAADYLTKPFSMDELALVVRRSLAGSGLRRNAATQVSAQRARFGLRNIIGESPAMRAIKDLVVRVARSDTTSVLLLGESGTGKDVTARAIHYESSRIEKPFVDITCTALPESLLESELFGYEKGAFTDAKVQKKGLFELANEGSVFLDEIADMRPALQAKLLRVLEEKTFKRLGGTADIRVDVRVIAATNRDIDEAMRQVRFREDLYYRLSTVPVVIPPLRERLEDIPLLANHFLHTYNFEFHQSFRQLSPEAMRKLLRYDWPGNVRELRNVIERAALLGAGDTLSPEDIVLGRSAFRAAPAAGGHSVHLPPEGCRLADVEKELVSQALERTRWNQTHAAELLGITRDQMRYKIVKYGLSRPD